MEAIHLHLTFAALTSIENQDNDFLLVLIKEFFTAQEINAIFTAFFYAQIFSRMPNSWTITQFVANRTTRAQILDFIANYHTPIYYLIKQPEIKALILVVIKVFNFAPHHEFQVDDLIKTTKFDGVFSDREDVKTLIATTNPEIMILFEEFFKPAVKQFLPIDQTTRIRRLNALARVLSLDPKITTWVCIAVRLTTDPSGNIRFHIAVNSPMDISKDKRFFQPGSDSKIDVFKKLYALMQDKDLLLNIIKSNFIFKNGVPKSLESSINIVDLHDPTILYTLVERHIEQNYEAQLQKLRANLILSSESRDEKIKQTEITCSSAIKKAHDAIKKCLEIDIANVGNYLYLINEELFNKKHTSGSGITLAEAEQMVLVKIDELEKSKSKKSAEILEAARDLTIQEKHITETQSLIQARIDWLYALAYNQEFCAEILTECSLSIAEQQSTQSAKLTTLVESLIQPLQHVHTLERINTLRARTRRDLKKIILSMRGYDYYEDGNSEIRTLGARNILQKRNRNTQHSHAEPTASVEIAQTNIKRHCELEIARKSILLIYIQNLFDLIIKHRSEHDLEDKFTAGQKATLEIIRVGLMPSSDPLATNFLALQEKFEQCSADDFHSISYNMLSTITILNELRQQPENKTIAIGISFKCCPKCSYELSDCGVPVYEQHTNTCPTTGIFDDVLLTDGLNPGAEFHDLSVSTYSTTKLFVTGQPQSIARFSGFLRPPAMVSTASEHSQELSPLASDRLRF